MMARYTDKKAAKYCNRVLTAVDGNMPEWSNAGAYASCQAFRRFKGKLQEVR